MTIVPHKLNPGDEIRVIAPSTSAKIISDANMTLAKNQLESMGFKVSFGKHIFDMDMMNSSSVESRLEDLHQAFRDTNVNAILTVIGGYNSNQLLNYIDYDLIKDNPKILCGFSDITALANAIYTKCGLVTYSGPHFSTFAMQKGNDYTIEQFKKMLIESSAFNVATSPTWSDDAWFLDQENREFYTNEGPWIIQEGNAEGTIIGGNLGTLQLLHGTEYMPSLNNKILFLESDSITNGSDSVEFDRDLQSLLHKPDAANIKALVFGRFEKRFDISRNKLTYILKTKRELQNIPLIANIDFGHTMPLFTFPIGGQCKLKASLGHLDLEIKG